MQRYIIYIVFGWLVFIGISHFMADVISQHLRGMHPPGTETMLYNGLHSAFALGQVVFGIFGLYVAWRSIHLFSEIPVLVLIALAGCGWLAISFLFMGYWEPKFATGIYCLLVLVAIIVRFTEQKAIRSS